MQVLLLQQWYKSVCINYVTIDYPTIAGNIFLKKLNP
jgi:hypothetical protein